MKIFLYGLVVLGLFSRTYGLDCYSCSGDFHYDIGNKPGQCFATNNTSPQITCTKDDYCRSKFTLNDGVMTRIHRECIGSTNDEVLNTTSMPIDDKCVTVFGRSRNTTECYYHCKIDSCNTKSIRSSKLCPSDCNIGAQGGKCDYLTGTCVCCKGYSGPDCKTEARRRKCIQCNSLIDDNCKSPTTLATSVDCPGKETYCSSTTTIVYDLDGDVIRKVVTRGCTTEYKAVDECAHSSVYTKSGEKTCSPDYAAYTCYSTCDTDGCNNNDADGFINGNEKKRIQCIQCRDTIGSGACDSKVSATPCHSKFSYCKSTHIFMVTGAVNYAHPNESEGYEFRSKIHECATASVHTECTKKRIGSLNLEMVTCVRTCREDGCNTGWRSGASVQLQVMVSVIASVLIGWCT